VDLQDAKVNALAFFDYALEQEDTRDSGMEVLS
jgi:hypothetical protein